MPARNHSYTVESLRSQAEMKQLRQTVNQIQHSIGQRIFESASRYIHVFGINFSQGLIFPPLANFYQKKTLSC